MSEPRKLVNLRTRAVLAERIERADQWWTRLVGLLGRPGLPEGAALLIEPCAGIHTFFMRFPIDAAVLSRELRVIRSISNLRPFRATRFHRGARMVLELPAGKLANTGTREGDTLAFAI